VIDNYSDYHQFAWVKISSRVTLKTFLKARSIPYILSFAVISSCLWIISQNQKIVYALELFVGLTGLSIFLMFLIGILDLHITKNLPKKIKSYKIDSNGIHINNKVHAHASVKTATPTRPTEEADDMTVIVPKKTFGHLKLEYDQPVEREKIIKALEYDQSTA
jgi:hypothetical protein